MAKKPKTETQTRTTISRPSRGSQGVIVVKQAAATVGRTARRVARRAAPTEGVQKRIIAGATGGAAVGFIEKTFGDQIPSIPLVGKKGTLALAVYMLKPKSKFLQDLGFASAVLAGYQLTKEGKIDGEGDGEEYDDD